MTAGSTATAPGRRPSARPVVGVLALQGDVREHSALLEELGARAEPVRRPDDLDGVQALVLPGGESTTMSMLLESSELFEPLAASIRDGMPVLGTCAGMILLARQLLDGRHDQRTFGAIDLVVRRNGFGRQVDSFEADLEVATLPGPALHAVFIRAPYVEQVGTDVEVLASVDGRPVLCRQGRVTAAAFHPELAGDTRLHEVLLHDAEGY